MIGHLMNTDVDVYRATYTADGQGGRVKTMAKVDTVRARVSQPSAQERAVAAQLGATLEYVVHVPRGVTVHREDELDTGDARRLRVQAVTSDSSRTYWRVECQVIQGG